MPGTYTYKHNYTFLVNSLEIGWKCVLKLQAKVLGNVFSYKNSDFTRVPLVAQDRGGRLSLCPLVSLQMNTFSSNNLDKQISQTDNTTLHFHFDFSFG